MTSKREMKQAEETFFVLRAKVTCNFFLPVVPLEQAGHLSLLFPEAHRQLKTNENKPLSLSSIQTGNIYLKTTS